LGENSNEKRKEAVRRRHGEFSKQDASFGFALVGMVLFLPFLLNKIHRQPASFLEAMLHF
jgi:hypothetical protein